MTAGVLPVVLSSDELRAVARLAGRTPHVMFDAGWTPEEAGVADAVALRGLLARGLAGVRAGADGPDVALTVAATAAFAPLLRPDTVVEVVGDGVASGRRRQLLTEASGVTTCAMEREPLVWQVRRTETEALSVVTTLFDELAEFAAPRRDSTITLETLSKAKVLFSQYGAHAPMPGHDATAELLARLLPALRTTVSIRVSRHLGPTTRQIDAITWLDAGEDGVWLLRPVASTPDPDADEVEDDLRTLVAVDPPMFRDVVSELLEIS